MAESNKEIDKMLNTSATPGSKPPAKGNHADADAVAEPKGLLDELDSKLDDLFASDDKDSKKAGNRQIIKSPLEDVTETPEVQKSVAPDKDIAKKFKTDAQQPPAAAIKKANISPPPPAAAPAAATSEPIKVQREETAGPSIKKTEIKPVGKAVPGQTKQNPPKSEKRKTLELDSFQPVHSNEIAEAKKEQVISKPTGKEAADKLKPKAGLPDKPQEKEQAAALKKPANRLTAGIDQTGKPFISKTESAPIPEKAPTTKDGKAQPQAKPVELKKEPKTTGPKPGKKKPALLKLAVGGIILVGGLFALFAVFQTPDPPHQRQPVAAPKAHKISKPPAKAPGIKTAPPAVQSVPPPGGAHPQQKPPPAVAAHEKKPVPPATPEINAADEIKVFLQEWKTAWEKSAGEKGDTDAFMSLYADDFTSNGLDKNRWRQDKAEKNRRKEWIRIELDKINIVGPLKNDRYEARFTQIYQSSNYADTSDQVLILKKETSGLKIIGTEPLTPSSYPYSIHDGSYRTLPSAREAVDMYRKMGLEAYWTSVDLGEKGTWYRVFIGYYPNLESALGMIEAKAIDDVRPEETRYTNLIGTYADRDNLERQRRLIAESGYSPYVIMNDNGSLNLYVGAHGTLKNAEKFSTELSAKGISSRAVER